MENLSSENTPDTTGHQPDADVAFMIAEGARDPKTLSVPLDQSKIDIRNSDERTPLMVACLNGREDIVKFFLENSADPNLSCAKDGNTPLHYTCSMDAKSEDDMETRSKLLSSQAKTRISILQLLLSSGAHILLNHDGLSPPCIAAVFGVEELVDFFMSEKEVEISLKEKLRAIELLGVSQALLVDRFRPTSVFDTFCRVLNLREQNKCPLSEDRCMSKLAECFALSDLKECVTLDNMHSIRDDKDAIKAHAFLVGDRVLPENLTKMYFLPKLLVHANADMYDENNPNEGFALLKYIVNLEMKNQLQVGSVLECIADSVDYKGNLNNSILQHTKDLIILYTEVVEKVDVDLMVSMSDKLKESLAEIMFNLAFYYCEPDILDAVLSCSERMIRHINRSIRMTNMAIASNPVSVVYLMMTTLAEAFVDNVYSGMSKSSLKRVKLVICRLLRCDSVVYTDADGNTILHVLMSMVSCARDIDYIVALAKAFVRHGCPLEAKNKEGDTAGDVFLEYQEILEEERDLLAVVSSPSSPLRLEEISARTLLRHQIPFRHVLPVRLTQMIEGENFDLNFSELKSSESESSDSCDE